MPHLLAWGLAGMVGLVALALGLLVLVSLGNGAWTAETWE